MAFQLPRFLHFLISDRRKRNTCSCKSLTQMHAMNTPSEPSDRTWPSQRYPTKKCIKRGFPFRATVQNLPSDLWNTAFGIPELRTSDVSNSYAWPLITQCKTMGDSAGEYLYVYPCMCICIQCVDILTTMSSHGKDFILWNRILRGLSNLAKSYLAWLATRSAPIMEGGHTSGTCKWG